MKTIYFCRHAKSSWDNPDWTDRSRPLNERGLRDAPQMAAFLKTQNAQIDLLLVSPANRTQQTADFYAAALGIATDQKHTLSSIYEAYPDDIYQIIQSLANTADRAMIVGHNPAMTQIFNAVSPSPIANVPTCGIFEVAYEVEDWQHALIGVGVLRNFWYPKQFI